VTGGGSVTSFAPSINTSTTYYAQARHNTTGCVSTSRLAVGGTVHTAVATASISGNTSNTCPSSTVSLSASATGATSFTWYRNSTQVQTGTNSAYTVTSSGSYTVQGKNANCTGSASTGKVVTINHCGYAVPGCSGFKVYQQASPADGTGTWSEADLYCRLRGARLPTEDEFRCICTNHANLPGGFNSAPSVYWCSQQSYMGGYDSFVGCIYGPVDANSSRNFRCVL
jgi:hypothetical protein